MKKECERKEINNKKRRRWTWKEIEEIFCSEGGWLLRSQWSPQGPRGKSQPCHTLLLLLLSTQRLPPALPPPLFCPRKTSIAGCRCRGLWWTLAHSPGIDRPTKSIFSSPLTSCLGVWARERGRERDKVMNTGQWKMAERQNRNWELSS